MTTAFREVRRWLEGAGLALPFPPPHPVAAPSQLSVPVAPPPGRQVSTSEGLLPAERMTQRAERPAFRARCFLVWMVFLKVGLQKPCRADASTAFTVLPVTPPRVTAIPAAGLGALRPPPPKRSVAARACSFAVTTQACTSSPGVAVRFPPPPASPPLITGAFLCVRPLRCRSRSTRASWRRRTPCSTSRS